MKIWVNWCRRRIIISEQWKLEGNVLGPNHIKIASSYNNLGLVHGDMGELVQDKDYYQLAMEFKSKVLSPNNIEVATDFFWTLL